MVPNTKEGKQFWINPYQNKGSWRAKLMQKKKYKSKTNKKYKPIIRIKFKP